MNRLVPISILLVSTVAYGQPSRAAEGEKLFRDAQLAITTGQIAEACALFEGSQRVDPNIGTLMNLADCRERNAQLATAWALFLQTAGETQGNPVHAQYHATSQKRARELELRLSHLIINVPDESRVPGLTITRNGVVLDPIEWNRSLPVDGGEFEVTAKAPDHEGWSTRITIRPDNDKQSVDVPRFKDAAKATEPDPAHVVRRLDIEEIPAASRRRPIAIVLGAGGVVGLVVGAGFGVKARSTYRDALAQCPSGPSSCAPDGVAGGNDARAFANASTVSVLLGSALIVGGIVLVLTEPERRLHVTPVAGPSNVGVSIGGAW